MQFEGIYPPVITPYNDDYSIDYDRPMLARDFPPYHPDGTWRWRRSGRPSRTGAGRSCTPPNARKFLIKWCKLIRRHQRELAVLASIESGKSIQEVENLDVPETLSSIESGLD